MTMTNDNNAIPTNNNTFFIYSYGIYAVLCLNTDKCKYVQHTNGWVSQTNIHNI